ncbi:diguanylate cyclase domain-containing protein [Pseudomonas fluorescens]|uniref:diguanylate cyclase domain-containing protein n=1 Tax=Pseudomonas fluorescens TaxID=294 RepID=UPI003D1B192B
MIFKLESARRSVEAARALQIASTYSNAIERVLEHALSATNALAVMVRQGHGSVPDFADLAHYMIPLYKGAYALSLAPEGVMRQIEPIVDNRLVEGHDLFEGQDRNTIIRALKNETLFWGPFKLIQGPQGAIGRLPVFLESASGEQYFWGFTVVTLKFPEALENADLGGIEKQGYAYKLSGLNPQTNSEEVISASAVPMDNSRLDVPVRVSGREWVLSVSKIALWQDQVRLAFDVTLILFVSMLMAWLAYSIAGLAAQKKKLQEVALYDALTGLPNRRLLTERMETALASARRKNKRVAVCYLDLDGFKVINDTLGHAAGDYLLVEVSRRLQSCLRVTDTLARVGGDEFVILLVDLIEVKESEDILGRVIGVASAPVDINGIEVIVSASVGAAFFNPQSGDEADQLLRRADHAMYTAKKKGKNRYLFADDLEVRP